MLFVWEFEREWIFWEAFCVDHADMICVLFGSRWPNLFDLVSALFFINLSSFHLEFLKINGFEKFKSLSRS